MRVERLLEKGRRLADRLQPAAALVTRLLVGYAFVRTGLGKWQNFEGTVSFFTEVGLPLPEVNAAFIAGLELAGGALLMAGLGTRLFAALLSSTMVVALLTADRARLVGAFSAGSDYGPTDVVPLVFLAFLIWLVAFGAGAWSLDRVFFRKAGIAAQRRVA
jgi:putative oxidoreductase